MLKSQRTHLKTAIRSSPYKIICSVNIILSQKSMTEIVKECNKTTTKKAWQWQINNITLSQKSMTEIVKECNKTTTKKHGSGK